MARVAGIVSCAQAASATRRRPASDGHHRTTVILAADASAHVGGRASHQRPVRGRRGIMLAKTGVGLNFSRKPMRPELTGCAIGRFRPSGKPIPRALLATTVQARRPRSAAARHPACGWPEAMLLLQRERRLPSRRSSRDRHVQVLLIQNWLLIRSDQSRFETADVTMMARRACARPASIASSTHEHGERHVELQLWIKQPEFPQCLVVESARDP